MSSEEPGLDVTAVLRAVDVVHPPAIVCAREGRSTIVDDGMVRLELIETAGRWRWVAGRNDEGPLPDVQHLFRVVSMLAQAYELEPLQRRGEAELRVEALYEQWIREATTVPPPRLWGACAPGRPLGSARPQIVLFDDQHPVSPERIATEAQRLHPAAHVSHGDGWPTLVDDGVSWVMLFEWWDGWRWSLDGEDRGKVRGSLELQVILAERARAYAGVDEERRQLAVEHVAMLGRLPIAERYQRAREHARGRLDRTG